MSEYVNTSTGAVITSEHLRSLFPDEHLGDIITDDVAKQKGYATIVVSPQPPHKLTQYVTRNGAQINALGIWEQAWRVVDMTAEQRADALQSDQAIAWKQIEEKRDRLEETSGILVVDAGGKHYWFQSDHRSKTKLMHMLILKADCPSVEWKSLDGTVVSLSHDLLLAYGKASVTHHNKIYKVANIHRQKMLLSDNPLAYNFNDGWPITYTQTEALTIGINNCQKLISDQSTAIVHGGSRLVTAKEQLTKLMAGKEVDANAMIAAEQEVRIATKLAETAKSGTDSAQEELKTLLATLTTLQKNTLDNQES